MSRHANNSPEAKTRAHRARRRKQLGRPKGSTHLRRSAARGCPAASEPARGRRRATCRVHAACASMCSVPTSRPRRVRTAASTAPRNLDSRIANLPSTLSLSGCRRRASKGSARTALCSIESETVSDAAAGRSARPRYPTAARLSPTTRSSACSNSVRAAPARPLRWRCRAASAGLRAPQSSL